MSDDPASRMRKARAAYLADLKAKQKAKQAAATPTSSAPTGETVYCPKCSFKFAHVPTKAGATLGGTGGAAAGARHTRSAPNRS